MPIHPASWTTLVTGGCGFVGRHLCRRLLGLGHSLFVVDDLSSGQHPDIWLEGRIHSRRVEGPYIVYTLTPVGDAAPATLTFLGQDILVALLGQLGKLPAAAAGPTWPTFVAAFHLASIVGGRSVIDGDPLHVGVDLGIDALFFRWVAQNRSRVGRVLYASSSAAYPVALQDGARDIALAESMLDPSRGVIGQPDMSYGWSKLTGEYLAHLLARHYGVKVACVRPFSGYGEDQATCYPVPAIAERVARGDARVVVWGSGMQSRDFVHIDDCITGILRASEAIEDGSAINIGTGVQTSFLQLARLMVRLQGTGATVVPQLGQPVGVQSRYADTTAMQRQLGFTPAITLEQGMARVLRAASARLARGTAAQPAAAAHRGHVAADMPLTAAAPPPASPSAHLS